MKDVLRPPLLSEEGGMAVRKQIRAAMGRCYFGPADWSGFYKGNYMASDCLAAPRFRWDISVLDEPCPFRQEGSSARVRDTHFVSLGLETLGGQPLTLARFVAIHPSDRVPHFNAGVVLGERAAQRTRGGLRWYLTYQGIVPNSNLYSPEEQLVLLCDKYGAYEVPFALEVAMVHAFYVRKCHGHLNPNHYVRCKDRTAQRGWIEVGCSDDTGIEISHSPSDISANTDIGIGASRRLPEE